VDAFNSGWVESGVEGDMTGTTWFVIRL